MATSGAVLGPILDGFHSRFGVLLYHDPAPFPVFLGGVELCQTAVWVPPLFGLAGIIIGTLYAVFDQLLDTPHEKRSPATAVVLLGILSFVLQYYLSGLLFGPLGPLGAGPDWRLARGAAEALLWAAAVAHWRVFDGTQTGLVVSALTAVGGPGIEIALLNAPGLDLYAYASSDILGFPTWAVAVYFCGGPAVGNLARATFRALKGSGD
mmetsp:Transcript_54242/g.168224  ORF Transcript_54242/g.168224 Transcript_54242/m.168224 type:complete len:209 (-) Transcript_54242:59-685(-)